MNQKNEKQKHPQFSKKNKILLKKHTTDFWTCQGFLNENQQFREHGRGLKKKLKIRVLDRLGVRSCQLRKAQKVGIVKNRYGGGIWPI
jgi:hypothetical protein